MASVPPLSIVIPTFNTAAMTLACCRAALAAAPGAEVIVVDDASSDDTCAVLEREVPDALVLRLPENRRFAGAANVGVSASSGQLVLLLNSDATLSAEAVQAFLAAFAKDARLGIAGARLVHPDGSPQWSGGPIPTILWLTVMVSGAARFRPRRARSSGGDAEVGWVSGAAMAFRREVWTAAGPLRESYRFYAQDLDFCARAHQHGWGIQLVEEARVLHGGGETVRQWRDVADLPHDPVLLWPDLMAWGRSYYGRAWAMVAFPVVCAAAALRIGMRRLLRAPRSTTAAYRSALQQLFVERQQLTGQHVAREPKLDELPRGVSDRPRP